MSCSQSSTVGGENGQMYCSCNLLCNLYTSRREDTNGRRFYRCPRNRKEGDCGFFRWLDEAEPTISQILTELRAHDEMIRKTLSELRAHDEMIRKALSELRTHDEMVRKNYKAMTFQFKVAVGIIICVILICVRMFDV